MSAAKDGLQIVAAPASGWCEPDTGACHLGPADEAVNNEDAEVLDDDHLRGSLPRH
ncbi:hypothetical protein [Amycolatopsis circi]|uniref:hypothetical protein n=1 Tax=Amycolatopsis circi TaxID=871959 RepID=UPI0013BE9B2E|nr:hypothetical protein [Amycolatopsis circi]